MVQIVYAREELLPSFHQTLDSVAKERIYIEMIEAPPLEKVIEFQKGLIAMHSPTYFAVDTTLEPPYGKVVGWIDVRAYSNPRMSHRAALGMGILNGYRGQGLGTRLMQSALAHVARDGVEQVELSVYSSNLAAQALYRKMGFVEYGRLKNYRKIDGVSFEAVNMVKFFEI